MGTLPLKSNDRENKAKEGGTMKPSRKMPLPCHLMRCIIAHSERL
nr:MAG TPA: hypothetical protein [Caudoviricetes sp.]